MQDQDSITFKGIRFQVGDVVSKLSGKPFKSTNKKNTIKTITINPHSNKDAFTFEEDESIVDVQQLQKETK